MTYNQLDRKASTIITKLRDEVAVKGYRENLGQDELRKFQDLVDKEHATLSFQERYQLTSMLSTAIDNI